MITALVAYTEAFDALADVTVPVLRSYCQRQGYDLLVHRGGFGDRSRQFGFQKTELVQNVLRGTKTLFVVDVDTMITNHAIRLESFMDDEHEVFACHDSNGLNAGAYLLRAGEFAEIFLNEVITTPESDLVLGEQDAMRNVFRDFQFFEFLKVLPHPSINSYLYQEYGQQKTHEEGQWELGDFLLHLPGMTNERRIEIFRSL